MRSIILGFERVWLERRLGNIGSSGRVMFNDNTLVAVRMRGIYQ